MYQCQFPGCNYETTSRTQIEYHHIVPKTKGGSNLPKNRIWLCPNHHKKIFIPGEIKGVHSKKSEDSIVILGWLQSTGGRLLQYKYPDLEEILYAK